MKALVQRVRSASVQVEDQVVSSIGHGMLILLGIKVEDGEKEALNLARKLVGLRIFEDEEGKMNRSLVEAEGELLVVSQFTLYADTSKGRRPSFQNCAPGPVSEPLYQKFLGALRSLDVPVQEGVFGAEMLVRLENDGPVTFLLEV